MITNHWIKLVLAIWQRCAATNEWMWIDWFICFY